MSRGQLRANSNICADCSAPDPTWASVNRGVLVCDECCGIHRSLGRHISQVKSLRKGSWSPTQLAVVQQLVSLGANNIWEYSLLDPSQNKQGRRKPNPRDPVHPTKADFIRAKYQFLAFMNKTKDSEVNSLDDLSKQLHSSVRTANLETSLRLLSLGADPNFFHSEKGNNPLHVAAQAGQASQVELLVVYGADPGAYDSNGKTPVEHARLERHSDLSDRLLECQYELTDRLAYFLCSRKPDHRAGQHFIIPEMSDSSLDMSELAKAAKKKLQALSNHLFEELAMDVYDEVDRRENNTIWLSAQPPDVALLTDRQTVPFLPVNPEFSSTRNQGRQKLARFNAREFATLIIDILSDARRRQLGVSTPSSQISSPSDNAQHKVRRIETTISTISDDEPLYDMVASDEDYASIGDNQSIREEQEARKTPTKEKSLETLSGGSTGIGQDSGIPKRSSGSPTSMISFTESMASDQSDSPITLEEYTEVKRALAESQSRVQQLVQTNKDLKQEISLLHNMVSKLIHENQTLKRLDGSQVDIPPLVNGQELYTDGAQIIIARQAAHAQQQQQQQQQLQQQQLQQTDEQRPQSMFEPRDHHHQQQSTTSGSQGHIAKGQVEVEYAQHKSVSAPRLQQAELQPAGNSSRESDYDNPISNAPVLPPRDRNSGGSTGSHSVHSTHSSARGSDGSQMGSTPESSRTVSTDGGHPGSRDNLALPTQDDVVKRTEKITKKIQELLVSAQEGKLSSYGICSEKISAAVQDMAGIFPQSIKEEKIKSALHMLTSGAVQLREQCNQVMTSSEKDMNHDSRLKTQQVIQCAYNIAKAAKQLVILFE